MIFEIEYIDGFEGNNKKYIQGDNEQSVIDFFHLHCPVWKILSIKRC